MQKDKSLTASQKERKSALIDEIDVEALKAGPDYDDI